MRTNGENRRRLGIVSKFPLLSACSIFVSRIIKTNSYGKGNYDIRATAQAVSELTTQVMELRDMVAALKPAAPDEKHRIVGIDEACIITHKAKPTIYTLARKRIIPAYKRGKKLYFYEDELLKWIEEGRKVISTKSYDEMLASMQSTVRNKPKNGFSV